jgi:hypothetical protein
MDFLISLKLIINSKDKNILDMQNITQDGQNIELYFFDDNNSQIKEF